MLITTNVMKAVMIVRVNPFQVVQHHTTMVVSPSFVCAFPYFLVVQKYFFIFLLYPVHKWRPFLF